MHHHTLMPLLPFSICWQHQQRKQHQIQIWVPWAVNRWRFRHIPGPWAPPVLGNLLGIAQHDLHGYLERCRKRHGRLFKVRWMRNSSDSARGQGVGASELLGGLILAPGAAQEAARQAVHGTFSGPTAVRQLEILNTWDMLVTGSSIWLAPGAMQEAAWQAVQGALVASR
jgi:hypothetical protein